MAVEAATSLAAGEASSALLVGLAALLVLWAVERCWLQPRRLGGALRAQGLGGTAYRFPAGDLPEHGRLNEEARSRPLPRGCHDIVPRVAPLLHRTVKEHGSLK